MSVFQNIQGDRIKQMDKKSMALFMRTRKEQMSHLKSKRISLSAASFRLRSATAFAPRLSE